MLSGRTISCKFIYSLRSSERYKSVSLYITSFNFKTLFWLVFNWYDMPWIEASSDIFNSTYQYALNNSSHLASCCSDMPCPVWTLAVISAILTKALYDFPQYLQGNCWDSTSVGTQRLITGSSFTYPCQQYYTVCDIIITTNTVISHTLATAVESHYAHSTIISTYTAVNPLPVADIINIT